MDEKYNVSIERQAEIKKEINDMPWEDIVKEWKFERHRRYVYELLSNLSEEDIQSIFVDSSALDDENLSTLSDKNFIDGSHDPSTEMGQYNIKCEKEIREVFAMAVKKAISDLANGTVETEKAARAFKDYFVENANKEKTDEEWVRYDALWLRYSENDPDGKVNPDDEVLYPHFGYIGEDFKEGKFMSQITNALNRLNGVHCYEGHMYGNGSTFHNGKIVWHVTFDNIAALNHFAWAGCFRYFPLNHNDQWLLTIDDGDPNYGETKLQMEFIYIDSKQKIGEIRKNVADMAKGINNYADEESKVKQELSHEKEALVDA